jgi:hypothetical protein
MSFLARFTSARVLPAESSIARACATQIVTQFAEAMRAGPARGDVANAQDLPYGKDEIGGALLLLIRATDDEHVVELLRSAFVRLADWQPGAGEVDVEVRRARAQAERRRRETEMDRQRSEMPG